MIKSKKKTRIVCAESSSCIQTAQEQCKSFTFIVLTHNHRDSIDRNIDSILMQRYPSFRVVYIDHQSNDGTIAQIQKAVERKDRNVSLVECKRDYQVYEQYYQIVSQSDDSEIIIQLCGSDYLAHEDVLTCLNQNYANPDVWLTYGQYIDFVNLEKGIHDPKPKKTLYKKRVQSAPWVSAPLKTYYAVLLKKTYTEKGFFISIRDENALLAPIAERAKAHVRFIPDVLYIHNEKVGNTQKVKRVAVTDYPIKDVIEKLHRKNLVDLILLSEDSPERLNTCLASCQKYLNGIATMHVIYRCTEKTFNAYEEMKKVYNRAQFIRFLEHEKGHLKKAMLQSFWENAKSSPYILLSTDQVEILEEISLPVCIAAMQKTHAYGFYFHLTKEGEKTSQNGIYSWNILRGKGGFKYPDTLQMGLYRRLDLERDIKKLSFSSAHDLSAAWKEMVDCYRLGLSFEESRVCATSVEMLTQP